MRAMAFSYDPAQLDRWNTRFSADGYLFGKRPNVFLESQASRLAPGMRALSVADGEGRNSVWLARKGLEVTAFDFSPVGVEKARALAREAGVAVEHHQCDIFQWRWEPDRYDVVVAIFVQFLTPEQRAAIFRGFHATLKAGGLLILQGYRPEQTANRTGGPPEVERLYTEELLRELLRDWSILHLASHDDVIDEGTAHRGMSALIDVVARKSA